MDPTWGKYLISFHFHNYSSLSVMCIHGTVQTVSILKTDKQLLLTRVQMIHYHNVSLAH